MSGLDQLQYISWLLYLTVFVAVLLRTLGRPTPAHIDMTLFFASVAVVIVLNTLFQRLHVADPGWLANDVSGAAAFAWGYLLLRLVRDFSEVKAWVMRSVEVGLLATIVALVAIPDPRPLPVTLLMVAYLVVVLGYDTWAFVRHAQRSRGVTRRRMQAAAAGSLSLVLVLIVATVTVALPDANDALAELSAALGLVSGVFYFIAFAPPTWLRSAWQAPEVRSFLAHAASLPRLPDTRSIVNELGERAADALGAPAASLALWDPDAHQLGVYYRPPTNGSLDRSEATAAARQQGVWLIDPATHPVIGRSFLEQRAILISDALAVNPEQASVLALYGARAVLSAPITAGDKRLGVLVVYAPRAPVFANSDLELVQLLADQAAVILESRALIDESARVRAREEATRLKEDFLSSAAHDLKTPLTGLVTQAQILQRRADRDPLAPPDRAGIDRLLQQSLRLKDLVLELLDVSRMEQGGLVGEREELDLAGLVHAVVKRQPDANRVEVEAWQPVRVLVDSVRFSQVVNNLVENALKYSSHTSGVAVRVWAHTGEARLCVQDRGIGIPINDQPLVFERFHRAGNVDDRRFAGMGLGLYIARGIVEQHGGRIWVVSTPGEGSTFYVALPGLAAAADAEPHAPATESRLASA